MDSIQVILYKYQTILFQINFTGYYLFNVWYKIFKIYKDLNYY